MKKQQPIVTSVRAGSISFQLFFHRTIVLCPNSCIKIRTNCKPFLSDLIEKMQDSNVKTFPIALIRGSAVELSDIEVIGSYSVNGDGEYMDDLSSLRYYNEPANKNVHFNLNFNANTTIPRKEDSSENNFLLKWISDNFHHLEIKDANKNKAQRLVSS